MDAKMISFVMSGKNRRNVLNLLSTGTKLTSSQIYKKLNYTYLSHVIRTLKDLEQKGLVKCLNPEDRIFKFYEITKKGKEINKETQKMISEL
jgi:DNA-binding PadR family transcriptional regulator